MSLESTLHDALAALCPRVSPDSAETLEVLPYITYQQIGGTPMQHLDGTLPDKRNGYFQVDVYATTRAECVQLGLAVQAVLIAHPTLVVRQQGEMVATMDPDTRIRVVSQDFSIWAAR